MIRVNLLPEEIRENIDFSKKNRHQLKNLYGLILLVFFLVIAFGLSYYFMDKSNKEYKSEAQKSQNIMDSYNDVVAKSQSMESKFKQIKVLKNKYIYWSNINEVLESNTPEGVALTNLDVNNSFLSIAGKADEKKNVAKFLENLKNTNMFYFVDLMSVERNQEEGSGTIETFNMEISIKPILLKNENNE